MSTDTALSHPDLARGAALLAAIATADAPAVDFLLTEALKLERPVETLQGALLALGVVARPILGRADIIGVLRSLAADQLRLADADDEGGPTDGR